MIEISCQTCGTKAGVHSFLAAAQQTCGQCGQLLMGALASGGRVIRPSGFEGAAAGPQLAYAPGRSTGRWVGMIVGMIAGVGLVAAVAYAGLPIPHHVRNAVLMALTGVLLAPVIAIFTFLSMIILPFSLEAIIGDSIWSRLARANNEGSIAPLFLPFVLYVVGPMALLGLAGSRINADATHMAIPAGLGALLLGALVGSVFGSLVGRRRQA